jgi:hypothetical protein
MAMEPTYQPSSLLSLSLFSPLPLSPLLSLSSHPAPAATLTPRLSSSSDRASPQQSRNSLSRRRWPAAELELAQPFSRTRWRPARLAPLQEEVDDTCAALMPMETATRACSAFWRHSPTARGATRERCFRCGEISLPAPVARRDSV